MRDNIIPKKKKNPRAGIPSKRKGDVVAWLLGFDSSNWAHSLSEFESKYEKNSQNNEAEDYYEWEYKGDSFIFMRCTHNKKSFANLACFISDAITKQEVLELIPEMTRSVDITMQLLKENFGITHDEFQAVWESAV